MATLFRPASLALLFPLLHAACSAPPAPGAARPAGRDTTTLNYALRQAYADSVDRARLAAFFAEYQARARPFQEKGNYLGEMGLLQELAAKYAGSAAVRSITTQQIGTFASFLGDDVEAQRRFDALEDDPPEAREGTLGLDTLEARDAVEAIVALARTHRVIFLNEAHHVPRHRALALALLPRLRELGFAWLAVETLSDQDSALNTRGYAVHTSGYYSNEPVFGELLRQASRLGYRLVPYEPTAAPSQDARELGMATNLRDRIFARDSNARVLVYAGYAHINEAGLLGGAKPMAVQFRELTGIDPLSVDQTTMREHVDRAKEIPGYRRITGWAGREQPFVLVGRGGNPVSVRPGVNDLTVWTPPARIREGRPAWLWEVGHREAVAIPRELCRDRDPCVIAARRRGESPDAVPADAVLVHRGQRLPALVLGPGSYEMVARDRTGAELGRREVEVVSE